MLSRAWWAEPVGRRGIPRSEVFRTFASAFIVGVGLGGMVGLVPFGVPVDTGNLDPVVGFTLIAVGSLWQWWPRPS